MNEIGVPVAGGELSVVEWPGEGPAVIAVHGITANAVSWQLVAGALAGRVRLIAVDLRGRARSGGLPGPYGMAAHAADVIAVADHFGLDRVTLAGHSMGAFVVTETVALYPDRVSSVLLVDGGVPLAVPAGIDVDEALLGIIGGAMRRLSMTFPTAASYIEFFKANPALGNYWLPEIEEYVLRDYSGTGSLCNIDAIRADARDMLTRPAAFSGYPLLWAPRGLLDETPGLYTADMVTGLDATLIPDVNHYTILLGPGAAAVADRIHTLK